MPKTNVKVKLSGTDGNAFAVMGKVIRALENSGHADLVATYKKEAMSGDYDHLLWVSTNYVTVS